MGKIEEEGEICDLMSSEFCKNISYVNYDLSNFGATSGIFGFKIQGSRIGKISVVGGGNALISESTVYNDCFVNLRGDYGSRCQGNFEISDCNLVPTDTEGEISAFAAEWQNCDFEFESYMPQ